MAAPRLLPKPKDLTLRFLVDEGVGNSVGRLLQERGHEVTYGNRSLPRGTADQLVCVAALKDEAILVAADHDMKAIARGHGISNGRFKSLNLIKISCRAPEASAKLREALSIIEHEWECLVPEKQRRIWIEIKEALITIRREFSVAPASLG